jgi:monoamine oxidase
VLEPERQELVVIGAGAAGLSAASTLRAAGLAPLVLEARDRIGGRILTDRSAAPVELGAEFIHGEKVATWEVLALAGLRATRWGKGRHFARGGRLLADDENRALGARIERLYDAVTHYEGPDISAEELIVRLAKHDDEAAMGVRRWLAGMEGAFVERLSARWLAWERAKGGADWINFHVDDGYSRVPEALAQGLEIQLSTPVVQVAWEQSGATLTLASGTHIAARHVIVSVPLSLLQQDMLVFEPALPAEKRQAIQSIAMGHVTKLALWFEQAFWPQFTFLSTDGLVPSWWVSGSMAAPALMGYAGGRFALELAALGEAAAIEQGLGELEALFGTAARRHFLRGRLQDWSRDPWALGAYTYTPVGGGEARRVLAAPLGDSVFFAGEATHYDGHLATVHGALESGRRAADEVLACRDS